MPSQTPSRSASSSISRSVSSNSLSTRKAPSVVELSAVDKEKEARIAAACQNRDLGALIEFATSASGLVTDASRRTAWPILLGCSGDDKQKQAWTELPAHKDEHQVGLDVNRAFVYYPKNDSEKQLGRRKAELSRVILEVLRRHPTLCYFQGYHDIVQVLLLVLGADGAPDAVARLSLLRVRDFMLSSIDAAIAQLELLRPIFRAADPELYEHLPKSQPSFALANTITMFAHNIQDYKDITRLFDFFLAQDAVLPIYLFAAVVLSRREDLLEVEKEDEDILYVLLGKLPQPFDVEFHIARTLELYERLPPASLASWEWWRLPSSSVLKSSADMNSIQTLTLQDGERFLAQHEKDIRRQQALRKTAMLLRQNFWYYRRYGYAGVAVLVGAYALWLGRNGGLASTRYSLSGPLSDFLRRLNSFITR